MSVLLKQYPAWGELVRKTWEQAFLRLSQIVVSVQTISAKGRYEQLFNHQELIQKTSPMDLVSMLSITDPTLSKK